VAAVTTHALRRALARAEQGKALAEDEAGALMDARGHDLELLQSIAAHLRDLGTGDRITYSRKVFIPLTMLCRDHCHYCTFAKPPAKLGAPFLTPDEVLSIARGGQARACKEALFTLGDRPEDRYDVARGWLISRGFDSTLEYVRASAISVIEQTGLLPHLNPGVMSYEELARLKQVSASMGLMLETSSDRLSTKGGPHFGSPDKHPAVRLRTIEDAGRLAIPFTTGILVGIGEDARERAASVFAIRELHRRYGHIQEVIVQNFLAKPGTAMASAPGPGDEEFLAAVATTRVVMGPHVSVQAPPNLSDTEQQLRLLDAGISDWGGVSPLTPDHVNPERPWPAIESLAATTASRGKILRERLTIYPRFAGSPDPYLAGRMRAPVEALLGDDGLAVEGAKPEPASWQDPEVAWKPRTIDLTFAKGPEAGLRADADAVYGEIPAEDAVTRAWAVREVAPARLDDDIRRALRLAEQHRPLSDDQALALFQAEGVELEALRRVADGLREVGGGAPPRGRPRPPRGGRRRRRHLRDQPQHQLHERLLRRVPLLRVRAAGGRSGGIHAHARGGCRPSRGGVGRGGERGVHTGRDPPGPARLLLPGSPGRREGEGPGDARARVQSHGDPERRHEDGCVLPGVPRRVQGARPGNDPWYGR
jgi:FO synthase